MTLAVPVVHAQSSVSYADPGVSQNTGSGAVIEPPD